MKTSFIIVLCLALFGSGIAIGYVLHEKQGLKDISSFEECSAAGFPVQESFPAKCSANGKTFTQSGGEVKSPNIPPIQQQNQNIQVASPQPNGQISSPLTVTGQAKGGWYFEASFPVTLLDGNGNVLAQKPAQAQGDWMTTNFVPFTVTLTYNTPTTPNGTLVLEKDNPSGLPQNAESISIPVTF